jgi:arabinose-5-phosphate isomerase
MRNGIAVPKVHENAHLNEALVEMTQKRLGMTTIINDAGKLVGIFTDGDLRRVFDQNIDIHTTLIKTVMTRNCKTIPPGLLAAEAIQIMESYKITSLLVIDPDNTPIGVVHLHDLLSAGVV